MPTSVLMPALSPTMEEGTLAKWHVKVGDTVSAGDIIAEIETDKATMEVEAVDEGTVHQLLVDEGTDGIKVNTPILIILEEGESADDAAAAPAQEPAAESVASEPQRAAANGTDAAAPVAKQQAPSAQSSAPAQTPAAPRSGDGARVSASPLARRLAAQANLDLGGLAGSGPNGRVIKRDVDAALAQGGNRQSADIIPMRQQSEAPAAQGQGTQPSAAQPAAQAPQAAPSAPAQPVAFTGEGEDVKLSNMRKTIARRLTDAKRDVPHYYLTIDCTLDELLRVRKTINDRAAKASDGIKISVNDFVIRAAAMALIAVPEVNTSWGGDKLFHHAHADVGVAVAIEGGLITPIIFKAETKGLVQIAREAKDLAERARNKKLKPEDYEGGSFSISNLGMFGIKHFTAVINPPHAAILAVGAGEPRPVIKSDGQLGVATVMTCTLSCDHRVVDGAVGARFLQVFKGFMEDPATMLA